jgi:hypothetical protein
MFDPEAPVGDPLHLVHVVGGHDHQGPGVLPEFQDDFFDNPGVIGIEGSGHSGLFCEPSPPAEIRQLLKGEKCRFPLKAWPSWKR